MARPDARSAALRTFVRFAAIAITFTGAAVVAGWIFQRGFLHRLLPGLVSMKLNTALCFVGAGVALFTLTDDTQSWRLLRGALSIVVMANGAIVLAQYLAGANWGVDELLMLDRVQLGTPYPGRMAPSTAICFTLLGLALLTSRPAPASGRGSRWLAGPPMLISALALVGYAYGVTSLYAMESYSGMALHTATALFLLSLAVIAANPTGGFMEVLVSNTTGGIIARRLLPATTIIIFSLGWIRLAGQRAGIYGPEFGLAVMVVSCIIVFSSILAWQAALLHRADLVRRGAEAEIVELNALLEARVEDRTRKLEEAMVEVRQLGSLLPICAWCNRIRDEHNAWHSVEEHVSTHTETRFTHAMCPECAGRMSASAPGG